MCLGNPKWRSATTYTVPEEQSKVVADFTVDVEGQGLYAIAGGLDANLFSLDPNTGVLSFRDNPPDFENPLDSGQNNIYNVTVQFTDIRNATVSRDITIQVIDQNDAPIITSDGGGDNAVLNVSENQVAVTNVNATDDSDSEGDGLVYSISGGDDADAFTIDQTTGELNFNNAPDFETPSDQNGDNMFDVDVTVTDSTGFDPASLEGRRVAQFDDNFYIASTYKQDWSAAQADARSLGGNLVIIDSAAEKNFIQQTFRDLRIVWTGLQDTDGDNRSSNIDGSDVAYNFLNRNSINLPPGTQSIASYAGSSAVTLYGLSPYVSGISRPISESYHYVIEIDPDSDEFIKSDTQTLKINVIDQQANAVDDTVSTPRETPIEIDVLANDTASQGVVLQLDGIGRQPINGSVVVNDDGTITYTPNDGFSGGLDTFTYEISDGLGEVGEATVTINVNPENTAPEATDDSVTTAEDTPITIDVRANDQDINNDTISLQSVGTPNNGTAQIVDGQVVYTPDQDFNGTDIFTYSIGDGEGGQDTAEIRVDVTPVNDNPVAVDDVRNIERDQTIVINPVTNDTDVDGDTVELTQLTSAPTQGAAFISQDGNVVYDPNPSATGEDSFTYEISDGNGGTDIGTISINIGDPGPDTDGDGVPDVVDLDDDNDGISDQIEDSVGGGDSDGDGVLNRVDLDSDNDGINDVDEAGPLVDNNGDGFADGVDNNGDGIIDNAPSPNQIVDTDNDGVVDHSDLDSDNDTISDLVESGDPGAVDQDDDGVVDGPDTDGDGIRDSADDRPNVFGDRNPLRDRPADTDGDGVIDSRDIDSDDPTQAAPGTGDGIGDDIGDAGNSALDPNQDGTLDNPADGDGDGIANSVDEKPNVFGGLGAPNVQPGPDTDGDGVPDVVDLDDDNDGISDQIEDSVGGGDSDGDGVLNRVDLDSDNDGINDVDEAGPLVDNNGDGFADGVDNNGDGIIDNAPSPNQIVDTDNDGVVDHSDLDSDNDTISDLVESGDPGAVDQDDDGVVDGPDTDGDGIRDSADDRPNVFGDRNPLRDRPADTDGDGVIDSRDIDSDDPTQAAPGTGDGIGDDIGDAGNSALDPNQDGTLDNPADGDGDGIANSVDEKPNVFGGLGAPNVQPPQGDLTISGQVRNDLDGDGNLNDPDPGIGGVRINLFADFNNDDREDRGGPVATTTTDTDGTYRFSDLDAGNYIVKEVDPAGAVSTADSNGANPNRVVDVTVSNANPLASNIVFLDSFPGSGNDDPIAVNDNARTSEGIPINIDVLGNDTDPNSDPLTITDVSNPNNGTAIIQNGQVRYVPDANYTGVDIFDYTISDGNGGTDNAQVRVTVNPDTSGGKLEIFGTNRNDTLRGSQAAENIYGRAGRDVINAGGGADCLLGQNGNDTLKGMAGNDTLEGGAGSDVLYGGGGRDILVGQQVERAGLREVDTLIGGAGPDIFVLGDKDNFYYDLGGDSDYAKIEDFSDRDKLQLKGDADDYITQGIGNNLYLYCKGDGALKPDELVAILNDVDSLNLSGNQVKYV